VAQQSKATGTTGEVLPFVAPVATRGKQAKKPALATSGNRVSLPNEDEAERPPNVGNYFFERNGAGWQCKEVVYVQDVATGLNKRQRPYIAYLSRKRWQGMKAQYKEVELEIALLYWIDERKAEKGKK
jgi:hypothetical protein